MVCNISDIIPSYLSKYSSLDSSEILVRSTFNEDLSVFSFFIPLISFIITYWLYYHIVKVLWGFTILYIIYYITKDRTLFHLG